MLIQKKSEKFKFGAHFRLKNSNPENNLKINNEIKFYLVLIYFF